MKNTASQGRRKGLLFPLILIAAGLLFLLERNGLVDRQAIAQFLPLIPVSLGIALLVSRLRRAG